MPVWIDTTFLIDIQWFTRACFCRITILTQFGTPYTFANTNLNTFRTWIRAFTPFWPISPSNRTFLGHTLFWLVEKTFTSGIIWVPTNTRTFSKSHSSITWAWTFSPVIPIAPLFIKIWIATFWNDKFGGKRSQNSWFLEAKIHIGNIGISTNQIVTNQECVCHVSTDSKASLKHKI